MKFQLALMFVMMILVSLAVKSEAATNRTECVTDSITVKKETQRFYCTATELYDKVKSVSYIQSILTNFNPSNHR